MDKQSDLNKEEILRYDRHLRLQNFGLDKQLKLKKSRILIVGAGGLGCPIALYLAASGVGKIAIADDDKVETSNLQRQIAFSIDEMGHYKAQVLANKIRQLNPLIDVIDLVSRINADNIVNTIIDYDLVIDGTDNFVSRFLLADACYLNKIGYLHASVYQYQGQVSIFAAGKSPCFRCLFRKPPSLETLPPCAEAGILGVITGVIGSIAATEAIKHITDLGNSILGKVLIYDLLNQQFKKMTVEPDINCPLCGENKIIIDMQRSIQDLADQSNCIQRIEAEEYLIAIDQAVKLLNAVDKKRAVLLDVREKHEYEQGHIEGANFWALSEISSSSIDSVTKQLHSKLNNGGKMKSNGDSTIICYCQRGARSLKAVDILRKAGIDNTFSLDGGLEAWLLAR